ncbi:polysaccharide biosynthesis/export family protein [Nioella nitratireducens]|uniref:polysaccharide biosynthesis/export family protein n=1 Tax=Nioella nitratireducens TaxID=1287720 RepID=UPI0008FD5992|nr:polysaccharide biosynthesis/export family protein [Nioella nitratireducens]
MKLFIRVASLLGLCCLIAACSLPRGAGVEREIIGSGDDAGADFAVYPVTRDFLPTLAEWPVGGEADLQWITASGGSRSQIIRPGDTVSIRIWDSNDNSLLTSPGVRTVDLTEMVVSGNGTIFMPYIGDTRVSGMTPSVARESLQSSLEAIVPSAQVQLAIVAGRFNSVDLVGGVARPGTYPLPDQSYSILSLISEAGGVPPTLANPQIRLMRGGHLFGTSINRLYSEPQLDTRLQGGDRVIVEEDDRYFLSLGAAGTQAQHPFTQDVVSALDAISIIGGVSASRADPEGILILREYPDSALRAGERGPRQERVVFTLDLTTSDGLFSARHFRIQSGDLVLATESPVSSVQTVFSLFGSAFGLANAVSNATN